MRSQAHEPQLTWYPGSILPYASLWHTVLRVAALNRLRSGDLPDWPTTFFSTGQKVVHTLSPLHNGRAAVDTDSLARSLGEDPNVLRWSHFGSLAPWLRFAVTPGFRVCMSCIAQGYHTALFSLRLMEVCPIHATPLMARCACGRLFRDSISPADFNRAGVCACYQQRLFSRESCRCPTMDSRLTDAFIPVVQWLEQLSQLVRPPVWCDQDRSGQRPECVKLLFEWSQALDLDYPVCFARPQTLSCRNLTSSASGRLLGGNVMARNALELPLRSMSGRQSPAHWTYRAISRFIRRHVVREQDRYGSHSTATNGQHQMADIFRLDQYQQLKPIQMDWAQRLDQKLQQQPLPFLSPWNVGTTSRIEQFFSAGMLPSPDTLLGARSPLNQAARCWLAYHASGMAMMARLRGAAQNVGKAARVDGGNLHVDATEISSLYDWSAVMRPDGSLRFLSLSPPGSNVFAMAPPGPDKTARCQRVMQARQGADRQVRDACTGPCLTWTHPEGWHVSASVKPCNDKWRRHRLFGVQGAKPFFWLFIEGDRFVVRLCSLRLQTFGATAKAAIDTLRWCFQQSLDNLTTP